MRLDSTTFWYLLFLALSILVIIHVFIKNLMEEPIFRFEIPGLSLSIGGGVTTEPDDIPGVADEEVVPLSVRSPTHLFSPPHSPSSPSYHATPESNRKLIDYIKHNMRDMQEIKEYGRVKGHNFYSPYHDSTLHNEETDLSKFFDIYQSVPDTTNMMQNLQCGRADEVCKQPKEPVIDPQTGQPVSFDQGSDGTPLYKRDVWTYDNERPMNGGLLDGIAPSDDLQGGFAVYPSGGNQFETASYQSSYPYMQSSGRW